MLPTALCSKVAHWAVSVAPATLMEAAFTAAISSGNTAEIHSLLATHPTALTTQPFGDAGSLLHLAAASGKAEVRTL